MAAQRHTLVCNVLFRSLSARRANYNIKLSDVEQIFYHEYPPPLCVGQDNRKGSRMSVTYVTGRAKSRFEAISRTRPVLDAVKKDQRAVQQVLDRPVRSSSAS